MNPDKFVLIGDLVPFSRLLIDGHIRFCRKGSHFLELGSSAQTDVAPALGSADPRANRTAGSGSRIRRRGRCRSTSIGSEAQVVAVNPDKFVLIGDLVPFSRLLIDGYIRLCRKGSHFFILGSGACADVAPAFGGAGPRANGRRGGGIHRYNKNRHDDQCTYCQKFLFHIVTFSWNGDSFFSLKHDVKKKAIKS